MISEKLEFDSPKLPRYRKAPRRLDDGQSPHSFPDAKRYFRHQFLNAVDSVMGRMERRFDQPALDLYNTLEKILLNSFKGIECEPGSVERMCSHFGDDIDRPAIIRQLGCLQDVRQSQTHEVSEPITVSTVIGCLQNLGQHKSMFCEVIKLLKLFLILPVTSATAERSFNGLRRLKTFLRTRMTQELLNSLALLHVHKHITYSLDIMKEAKEFVSRSDNRLAFFGHFV